MRKANDAYWGNGRCNHFVREIVEMDIALMMIGSRPTTYRNMCVVLYSAQRHRIAPLLIVTQKQRYGYDIKQVDL